MAANPPPIAEPAAGTGALPHVEILVKKRDDDAVLSRPAAVALILQLMRRPGLTIDEVDALSMAVSHITRKCRQYARWRVRKYGDPQKEGEVPHAD